MEWDFGVQLLGKTLKPNFSRVFPVPADELSKLPLIGSLSRELLRLANFSFRHLHTDEVLKIYFANCTYLIVTFVKPTPIPDICHERHEYIRVNFFWTV